MSIQPIANYEQRLAKYKVNVRTFFLQEVSWMFAACLIVSLTMAYVVTHSSYRGMAPMGGDWRLLGSLAAIALMIPPIVLMMPVHPKPSDVATDQALRRVMGMDDSVAK